MGLHVCTDRWMDWLIKGRKTTRNKLEKKIHKRFISCMASSVFIGLRFCFCFCFLLFLIVYLKSIHSLTGRMMHNVKGKLAWCICVCFACVCVCTCYECLTGWRLWLLFSGTVWETNDISSPKASGRQIDTAACSKSGRHNYTGKKRRWCVCTTDECK